jgi:chlorobactene glucosyltransferase
MILFHIAVTSMLIVVLLTVAGNLVYLWRVGRSEQGGDESELVSVCVPARDEATRIGACLEALARQRYRNLEVLVLDDGSTDGTGEIARGFAGRVPGLRVLDGEPLAEGWVGKPHACIQLARAARGAWLLFTDADVELAPESVSRGLGLARGARADLLTALPAQRLGTVAEALAVPVVYFAVAGFLPMFLMSRSRSVRMAAASGQYMLFRREAYDAVGGHEAVRGEIVEDVALGRAIRRARLRLVIANGVDLATCRMYAGGREVVEGFSKNAYAGLGSSAVNLALLIMIATALFVAPPIGLVAAPSVWFAVETGLAVAARVALALAFRQPLWTALLHPVAVLFAIFIAARSFWLARFGGGVRWRGRRYE